MEKLKNELIEKVAVFQDKSKQKQIVRINMIPNQFIYLKSYNEELKETGIKLNSEKIELIDTLSGKTRKNSYPNGDIVYNNTSLYLTDVSMQDASNLKGDSETKRLKFFAIDNIPENIMDKDLIKSYLEYLNK